MTRNHGWGYVAVVLCCFLQHIAGVCNNGGTCINRTGEVCVNCSCPMGFTGPTCAEVHAKFIGSVTYDTALTIGRASLAAAFTTALKEAYPGYQDSSVTSDNLTASSCEVNYVVYITKPATLATFSLTAFQTAAIKSLKQQRVTNTVFSPLTGISAISATSDINECVSNLHNCAANAHCIDSRTGFFCNCNDGFTGNGRTCSEVSCLLSQSPKWPSQAQRDVFLQNKTKIPNSHPVDKMPYKTYIEYKCPDRYDLVSKSTGEKQTTVIECVGSTQATHGNSGWTGDEVNCVIKLEFTVALIMAVVSSAIIILVGGAFVISCTTKEKTDDEADALEMNNSFT